MRIWGFPPPRVSSQPRISVWLRSGVAQLDVRGLRDAPSARGKTPPLPAIYLLCLSVAPLQLFNKPFIPIPVGSGEDGAAGTVWWHHGGVGWALSLRHQDQLLVHNTLWFSSPAVAADGYGKRKGVESLGVSKSERRWAERRGKGRARYIRGCFLFKSSKT